MVKQTNTATYSFGDVQAVLWPDGTSVPEDLAAECSEILWDLIGEAFKYSNKEGSNIAANESLMDYLTREVPKRVCKNFQSQKNGQINAPSSKIDEKSHPEIQKRIDLVFSMAGMWGPYVGSETAKQSLRFLWLEECLEGENPFCAGTYSKVSEVISEPVRKGADIKLNQTVTKISGRANELGTVSVETKDGSKLEFDEVLVTTPLGWLKKHLDAFEPPVPERLQKAVESLGYGNLDKVRTFYFQSVK
jgi:hypothetical protein